MFMPQLASCALPEGGVAGVDRSALVVLVVGVANMLTITNQAYLVFCATAFLLLAHSFRGRHPTGMEALEV